MGWAAVRGIPWLCLLGGGSLGWRGSTPLTISSPSTEQVKAELEAELGLKIVQTGVGEVGVSVAVPRDWGSWGQGSGGAAARYELGSALCRSPGAQGSL